MPTNEASKRQAIRSLDIAETYLKGACSASASIDTDTRGMPKAFAVVAEHLLLLRAVFSSIHTHLGTAEHVLQWIQDMYPEFRRVADESCHMLRYIEDLFVAVASSANVTESYRAAVDAGGSGVLVEKAMFRLLKGAVGIALEPLVSAEQVDSLEKALQEVQKLPPSLEEHKTGIQMINHSSGNQFLHAGHGNLNYASGGFQVTGDNQNAKYFTGTTTTDKVA